MGEGVSGFSDTAPRNRPTAIDAATRDADVAPAARPMHRQRMPLSKGIGLDLEQVVKLGRGASSYGQMRAASAPPDRCVSVWAALSVRGRSCLCERPTASTRSGRCAPASCTPGSERPRPASSTHCNPLWSRRDRPFWLWTSAPCSRRPTLLRPSAKSRKQLSHPLLGQG